MPSIVGSSVAGLRGLLFEPFVTGPLLLLILRGPPDVRKTLLDALANIKYVSDPASALSKAVTALKWLFAIGAVSRVNRALNSLAINRWQLGRRGKPFDFTNGKEIIVITGGCSGFGALMAKGFAGKGQVVVIDVQALPEDLKAVPNLHYYKCDLTSPDEIASTAAAIKSEVGAPTVLINNAGIGKAGTILEASPKWVEKIFRVNLLSHWQLVQEFLPEMLKKEKGHIVSMASVASFVGVPGMVDYAASKVGLLAFHEGLNAELWGHHKNGRSIQTTIIHPTWARTALVNDHAAMLTAAKQEIIDPSVVANTIVKQVLKGKSGGQILIPSSVSTIASMRAWPTWMQESARNSAAKIALP